MAEDGKKVRLLFWLGRTQPKTGTIEITEAGRQLWLSARDADWERVISDLPLRDDGLVERCWPMVNAFCPFHTAQYSFLHYAAYHGAPEDVVRRLLEMGAWRSLQNAMGETPAVVAAKRGQSHLLSLLEPVYRRHVPLGMLLCMQQLFHQTLRSWDNLHLTFDKYAMRLPQLEPMLEVERTEFRFDVDTWYGGFNYELEADGLEPRLVCFGASRVVGGSEGKVEITPVGVKGLPLGGGR